METNRSDPQDPGKQSDPDGAQRHSDLQDKRVVSGRLPGGRYVRIVRPFAREFRRQAPGYLVATEHVLAPRGHTGRFLDLIRRIIIGSRIRTELEVHERLGKFKGLAVFASDNISSSAYATEEIMRVLVLVGAAALTLTMPITLVIIAVLAIVVISYQQVIRAYPRGGGSYLVAKSTLGRFPGLTAGAALITDYTLTVSVSIAAGVAALTSIFPALFQYRVEVALALVALITLGNLRGLRESGTMFAIPTYIYVVALFGLLGFGLFRFLTSTLPTYEAPAEWGQAHGSDVLGVLLVLRAFASGSVALTGTEAVSDGVAAFKPPEPRNAGIVLFVMGGLFAAIFFGMSFLSGQLGILPDPQEQETLLSQLTRTLMGAGTPYHYLVQFATALILVLAANTAFNGFPRLASILAEDRALPTQFLYRGDRLAYNVGIIALAVAASLVLVAFQASVTNLIPLYTVGVFLAFTLSQTGMVRHWWLQRKTDPRWRLRALPNTVGAVATGIVMVAVGVAKFALGAWMVMLLIPILVAAMMGIQKHYRFVEDALTLERPDTEIPPQVPPHVIVPVSRLDRAALGALSFARSISKDVTAVHISDDPEDASETRRRWERWGGQTELVIVESPYRALVPPLVAYIDALDKQSPGRPITVVLSTFVPRHFWEIFLHNQTAVRLKLRLFFRPNTIVIDVPYHITKEGESLLPGTKW